MHAGGWRWCPAGGDAASGGEGRRSAGIRPNRARGARLGARFSPKRRARHCESNYGITGDSPMKTTSHGLKRQTAAADLRRECPGDMEVGDTNQGHRWLAPVLAKLRGSVATTDRPRCSGFKAAAALGFWRRCAKLEGWLGLRVRSRGGVTSAYKGRGRSLACGPHLGVPEAELGGGADSCSKTARGRR
jgi:hypothetical protein